MRWVAVALVVLACVTACSEGDGGGTPVSANHPAARYVATLNFTFASAVNADTLSEQPALRLFSSYAYPKLPQYLIATPSDLQAFNRSVAPQEQVALPDLALRTYFLVLAPSCPEFFEYAGQRYDGTNLTISMHHFRLDGAACIAVMVESFHVFAAEKQPL